MICLTLGLLLAGIAVVAHAYGLAARDQTKPDYQSVPSQLAAAIVGRGTVYYVAMASLLAVLCLCQHELRRFPRLCRLVAADGFLPRAFAVADRRLVFSVGIAFITLTAGGLLIAFGGITDKLIPLSTVGAFLTFTMSQVGWWSIGRPRGRQKSAWARHHGLGAVVTVVALAVILKAKRLTQKGACARRVE